MRNVDYIGGANNMKIYVAGKWQDRKNVRKLMDELENGGHTVTYDWTKDEENAVGYPIQNTINDTLGVRNCDVIVGRFIDDYKYSGALTEMGMAIGLGKPVLIIGHAIDNCIFINHPTVQKFETELELLSFVRQIQ